MMAATTARQVAVFWDFENCRPSFTVSGNKVMRKIHRLVEGYGSISTFKAYVDLSVECINPRSYTLHSELQSSGLTLVHCPHNGKKEVADKMMIVDMLAFAIDTPPPATIAIITGDRDFSYAAAILKLRGYRIIMIAPNMSHASLKMQADRVFDWQKDVISANDLSPGANCFVPKHTYKPSQQTADTTFGSTPSQRLPTMTTVEDISFPAWINEPAASSHTDPKRESGSPLSSHQAIFLATHSHTREEPHPAVKHNSHTNTDTKDVGLSAHLNNLPIAPAQTIVEEPRPSDNSKLYHTRTTAQSDDVALAFEPLSKGSPTFSLLDNVISVLSLIIESESLSPPMDEWTLAGSEFPSPGSELVILSDSEFSTTSNSDTSFNPASLDLNDSVTIANEMPPVSIVNDDGLVPFGEPTIEPHSTVPSSSVEFERPSSCPAAVSSVESQPLPSNSPLGSSSPPASTYIPLHESETPMPPSNAESASSAELKSKYDDSEAPHSITPESTERFQPLIDFFIEMKALKGATRFFSSEVAAGVLRKDPNFYQKAGVTRLRPYIEEARKAGVIISPGMDGAGSHIWMEINPQLYPATGASQVPEPTPLSDSKAGPSSEPHTSPDLPIETYFSPLIVRLRTEKQPYRLLFSQLGEFIKSQHPGLYKQASVAGLSKYLAVAANRGIVRIGGTSGGQWAELMPAHCNSLP